MYDKEPTRKFLSQQFSLLRHQLGITQVEMARLLRISSRAYGDLERGKNCCSVETFLCMLMLLNKEEIWDLVAKYRFSAQQRNPSLK